MSEASEPATPEAPETATTTAPESSTAPESTTALESTTVLASPADSTPAPAPAPIRKPTPPSSSGDWLGTGRRKTSVARVRVRPGSGKITINGRPIDEYFVNDQDRRNVLAPLTKSGKESTVDVAIAVHGGGNTGQSGACMLGLARALVKFDVETFDPLRHNHLLTRDSRMKERKHYGLRGARRGTQFSKR